jgi:Undecaprenyl-phosphate glucose phosphotransferase
MAQHSLSSPSLNAPRRREAGRMRMIRHRLVSVAVELLRAFDIASAPICGLLAYYIRWQTLSLDFNHSVVLFLQMVVIANVMTVLGVYDLGQFGAFRTQLLKTVFGWASSIAILLVIAFFDKSSDQYSRVWIVYWLLLGSLAAIASRLAVAGYLEVRRRAGNLSVRIAVVGTYTFAQEVSRQITAADDIDVAVVGIFVPRIEGTTVENASDATVDNLIRLARKTHIDEIIIQLPDQRGPGFVSILEKLSELPVNVKLCPDLSDLPIPRLRQPFMINVSERPFSGWAAIAKRAEDIVLSALFLLLLAPMMLAVALLVKLDSKGPVFFLQRRLGFNNNIFTVYKFRTMTVEASRDLLAPQVQRNDPRVTRIGRLLRRTSIDELPQLINVLKGEMSLVGPRPHPIPLNERFADVLAGYLARHRVKPGITGWAQVNGWRGETATDGAMLERLKFDLYYIENWSLGLDLWILGRTFLLPFADPKAY